MMLNIIRKTKTYLLLIAIGACCFSCNQDKCYKATIVTDKEDIDITESYFYVNDRGTVFYYILDEIKRNRIFDGSVSEIKFSLENVNVAKPILESMFSSDLPKSDFMFLVDRQSRKIVVDTIQQKATMVIISNQSNINDLINKGIIKAEKIKD